MLGRIVIGALMLVVVCFFCREPRAACASTPSAMRSAAARIVVIRTLVPLRFII